MPAPSRRGMPQSRAAAGIAAARQGRRQRRATRRRAEGGRHRPAAPGNIALPSPSATTATPAVAITEPSVTIASAGSAAVTRSWPLAAIKLASRRAAAGSAAVTATRSRSVAMCRDAGVRTHRGGRSPTVAFSDAPSRRESGAIRSACRPGRDQQPSRLRHAGDRRTVERDQNVAHQHTGLRRRPVLETPRIISACP